MFYYAELTKAAKDRLYANNIVIPRRPKFYQIHFEVFTKKLQEESVDAPQALINKKDYQYSLNNLLKQRFPLCLQRYQRIVYLLEKILKINSNINQEDAKLVLQSADDGCLHVLIDLLPKNLINLYSLLDGLDFQEEKFKQNVIVLMVFAVLKNNREDISGILSQLLELNSALLKKIHDLLRRCEFNFKKVMRRISDQLSCDKEISIILQNINKNHIIYDADHVLMMLTQLKLSALIEVQTFLPDNQYNLPKTIGYVLSLGREQFKRKTKDPILFFTGTVSDLSADQHISYPPIGKSKEPAHGLNQWQLQALIEINDPRVTANLFWRESWFSSYQYVRILKHFVEQGFPPSQALLHISHYVYLDGLTLLNREQLIYLNLASAKHGNVSAENILMYPERFLAINIAEIENIDRDQLFHNNPRLFYALTDYVQHLDFTQNIILQNKNGLSN